MSQRHQQVVEMGQRAIMIAVREIHCRGAACCAREYHIQTWNPGEKLKNII